MLNTFHLICRCEIPPSPNAYGSTPIIIPSSPTEEVENQSAADARELKDSIIEQKENSEKSSGSSSSNNFDILANNTLATASQMEDRKRKQKDRNMNSKNQDLQTVQEKSDKEQITLMESQVITFQIAWFVKQKQCFYASTNSL